MTIVRGTVRDTAGKPVFGATVAIDLVTSPGSPGFLTGATVSGVKVAVTGADGSWSHDLTPNASILPAGSHYRVRERVSANSVYQYSIIVPDSATPLYATALLAGPIPVPETIIPASVLQVRVWDGSKYVPAVGATHYIGPSDPGTVPDGSEWFTT